MSVASIIKSGLLISIALLFFAGTAAGAAQVQYFHVPKDSGPHDVALAPDGSVWFTGQRAGFMGRLDPRTGKVETVPLGKGAAPHGVIVGPDGGIWITEGGQNAIARADPKTHAVRLWKLPESRSDANLNTAAFDKRGRLWFTGQNGIYGRLDPRTGDMKVWDAPRGRGPYGINAAKNGDIWFVSLAGNYLAHVNLDSGAPTVIDPPDKNAGTRRVWPDSKGRLWVSEWNAGKLAMYNPATKKWSEWAPPVTDAQVYAVYVDENDKVWISEWTSNAIMRFDPTTEKFESFPSNSAGANVRQLAGRRGEVWGAESGLDRLVVVRF